MTTVRAITTVIPDVLETHTNDCSLPIDVYGNSSLGGLRGDKEMYTSCSMATTSMVKENIDRVNNSGNSNSSTGSVVVSQYTDSNVSSVPTSSIIDVSEFDSGGPSTITAGHVVGSDDSYIDYSIALSEESDCSSGDDDDYEISEYDGSDNIVSISNHGAGILDNAKEGDEDIRSIDDIESTASARSPTVV
eukprot:gene42117-55917_t